MNPLVMVAVDPDAKENAALEWATEWCVITGQELVIVSAFSPDQAEVDPDLHDEMVDRVKRDVDSRASLVADNRPFESHVRIVDGEASGVIVEAATSLDPSVVVLGARGSGGFEELGLGGVAHHVAHHLTRPMVVVPRVGGALGGGTVVAGVDGSMAGRNALKWAVDVAERSGSILHVVFAYDPMADSYPHGKVSNWTYNGEEAMREEVESLDPGDVDVRVSMVGRNAVDALTSVASEDDAALIVVGTRGAGGFHGLILGRVPAQLLHHAGRPVALVHHPN